MQNMQKQDFKIVGRYTTTIQAKDDNVVLVSHNTNKPRWDRVIRSRSNLFCNKSTPIACKPSYHSFWNLSTVQWLRIYEHFADLLASAAHTVFLLDSVSDWVADKLHLVYFFRSQHLIHRSTTIITHINIFLF